MPREIGKTQSRYISTTIKKLYVMFLKYEQPVCAQNGHAMHCIRNLWYLQIIDRNQTLQKQSFDVHSDCLFYYCIIRFNNDFHYDIRV